MDPVSLRSPKAAMLVAQRIVADIQRRGTIAGDRLPGEGRMLAEYGVARSTLREALRFLELQGVIALKPGPGGGPVVQAPNARGLAAAIEIVLQLENAPFRTVVEARKSTESALSALAATRISARERAALQDALARMGESVAAPKPFGDAYREFHAIIARSARNDLLAHLATALTGIMTSVRVAVDGSDRETLHRIATVLAEALAARDPSGAASATRDGIDAYVAVVIRARPRITDAPITWT